MKKPKTIQEEWLWKEMKSKKERIKELKMAIRNSRNVAITAPINVEISKLENDQKIQKIIYSQITNYSALK